MIPIYQIFKFCAAQFINFSKTSCLPITPHPPKLYGSTRRSFFLWKVRMEARKVCISWYDILFLVFRLAVQFIRPIITLGEGITDKNWGQAHFLSMSCTVEVLRISARYAWLVRARLSTSTYPIPPYF